jgi:predicted dehydrogenase
LSGIVRVAMIGCGDRAQDVYLPVLAAMPRHFRLCAVCDPDESRAAQAAVRYGVPGCRQIAEVLDVARPDACVLAVSPPPASDNGAALLQCVQAGVPALAETPIAVSAAEADDILAAVTRTGVVVEIAENYFRTPRERFKRMLLDADVFGPVNVAYADFVGHGYHGIAVLRSYIGFEHSVVEVRGDSNRFPVAGHRDTRRRSWQDDEFWQFGVLEFGNGARGVFSFSTLAYHSPIRPRTRAEVRFLAARGMGVGDELTVLTGEDAATHVVINPVTEMVDGIPVLAAITATGTDVTWENPLRDYGLRDTDQHGPLTIGLQLLAFYRAISGTAEPEYGVASARYDRLIDLALQRSWRSGMPEPVTAAPGRPSRP